MFIFILSRINLHCWFAVTKVILYLGMLFIISALGIPGDLGHLSVVDYSLSFKPDLSICASLYQ